MEEKKIIGMPYKCVLGLTWLLFPFGIVALAVDHEKMERDEKQHIVQAFVWVGITAIISIILGIINSIVWAIAAKSNNNADWMTWIFRIVDICLFIVMLIMMIEAFLGKFIKIPLLWDLAGKFLGEPKKEETKTESDNSETIVDKEE